ncbi:hypothetical protein BKA93DRAFT_825536 [Sparassis latifolia]|uniref:Calcium uniporter protein, mitochondrial n=1 Tax=Sparassis crispa TaxID=139825 RepID=A0A401GMG2_9APHY|nr:hypothetical protein SCP_0504180 [Sparassis crispa]GBE83370.1 hypothetical protein SCP_0504180 [Sparassis crispa]
MAQRRRQSTAQDIENTSVGHSRFLAEASRKEKWKDTDAAGDSGNDASQVAADDLQSTTDGKGKLSPTSSHLFKLILPLGHLRTCSKASQLQSRTSSPSSVVAKLPPPTIFLLHPSQPLSHLSRLIAASLAPATPTISFRSTSPGGKTYQWSDSTDVADFIRDAARTTEFEICVEDEQYTQVAGSREGSAGTNAHPSQDARSSIRVEIPSFEDRTRFLRRRLTVIEEDLKRMEDLKRKCDTEADRGARRMAMGGFGMLVVYWTAVARLTFWDFGWGVMEPITYLSGLSTVILGYLWFLYQGREVSYSSVLQRSISARREVLYQAQGLDIDRWTDLVSEAKRLRKEIGEIAEDYDEHRWKVRDETKTKTQDSHGEPEPALARKGAKE